MCGYTQPYGKTYDEWVNEKVNRIFNYLKYIYDRQIQLDKQKLAESIYIERLLGLSSITHTGYSKLLWKPINNQFTDFKPSPFIKNFINYLVNWMIEKGYLDSETFLIKVLPSREELYDICYFKLNY